MALPLPILYLGIIMGKISLVKDGKVLDWRFKRMNEYTIAFYVGDIYVGQVFKMKNRSYAAVCAGDCKLRMMEGFATRYAACHFILVSTGMCE